MKTNNKTYQIVILNLIQDLQRLPLRNNLRGRCQIKFGMTALFNNGGFTLIKSVGQALPDNAPAKGHLAAFTLIELLVVVLIIGILAAVALPQYQMAVAKSRATQMLIRMDALKKAAEVFYLATGIWTKDARELEIDIAGDGGSYETVTSPFTSHEVTGIVWSEDEKCVVYPVANDNSRHGVGCVNKDLRLTQEGNHSKDCAALTNSGEQICRAWSGKDPVHTYDNGLHRWKID